MGLRFNPPPNWPASPDGWRPGPGWRPDPSWGPPPYGWQFWSGDSASGDSERKSEHLPSLVAIYLVLFGVGAVITLIGVRLGPEFQALFAGMGFTPATAGGPIHKWLVGKRTHRSTDEVALAAGFQKSWWVVLSIGATIYFVALQLAGFINGLLVGMLGAQLDAFMVGAAVAVIVTSLSVLPLLGLWAGLRVGRGAYLLPPLMGLLGQFGGLVMSWAVLLNDNPEYDPYRTMLNGPSVLSALSVGLLVGIVAGVPLVFVGRRNRASQYLAWVAKRTVSDVHPQRLEGAFEEPSSVKKPS